MTTVGAIQRMYSELDREDMHVNQGIALELDMTVAKLRGIRQQFLRRLTGRCPVCGLSCGSNPTCLEHRQASKTLLVPAPANTPSILRSIPAESVMFRQTCTTCGLTTPITAGIVVEAWNRGFRLPQEAQCLSCRDKKRSGRLTYRPFQVLDGQKAPNR